MTYFRHINTVQNANRCFYSGTLQDCVHVEIDVVSSKVYSSVQLSNVQNGSYICSLLDGTVWMRTNVKHLFVYRLFAFPSEPPGETFNRSLLNIFNTISLVNASCCSNAVNCKDWNWAEWTAECKIEDSALWIIQNFLKLSKSKTSLKKKPTNRFQRTKYCFCIMVFGIQKGCMGSY